MSVGPAVSTQPALQWSHECAWENWVAQQLGACAGSDIASEDSLSLKRQQSFQLAKPSPVKTSKKGEVAGLIAAFAGGFAPAQRAMVNADGLPKLTHLLTSASLDVQDKALSALLVSLLLLLRQYLPLKREERYLGEAFNLGNQLRNCLL